jgi:hypothetical protein
MSVLADRSQALNGLDRPLHCRVGSVKRRGLVEVLDDLVVAELDAPRGQPAGFGNASG